MRVRYRELPDALDAEIRKVVAEWRSFLPGWVDTLTVSYDDTDANSYASATAWWDQRSAGIAFHPMFWSLDARGRALTLLHEIGHVLMAPLDQCVETIIAERPRKALAERLWSDASEGYVNDLAALAWHTRDDPQNPGDKS